MYSLWMTLALQIKLQIQQLAEQVACIHHVYNITTNYMVDNKYIKSTKTKQNPIYLKQNVMTQSDS